jgi:hypothetical protein
MQISTIGLDIAKNLFHFTALTRESHRQKARVCSSLLNQNSESSRLRAGV